MLAVLGKSSGKCGGATILCYAASVSKRRSSLSAGLLRQANESESQRYRASTCIGATALHSDLSPTSSPCTLSELAQSSSAQCQSSVSRADS